MQDDKEPQGNPWMKSVMIWSGILLAMLLVASRVGGATQPTGAPPRRRHCMPYPFHTPVSWELNYNGRLAKRSRRR